MASKRACDNDSSFDDEEPTPKRQKIQAQEEPAPSLDSLNDDCLLLVLSYTATSDLNSFAICSKRCCAARAHETLDQAREGTIIISERFTYDAFVDTVTNNHWNEEFQGNRVAVKIERVDRLPEIHSSRERQRVIERGGRSQLVGVKSLQLACSADTDDRPMELSSGLFFSVLFPNLEALDLSNVETRYPYQHDQITFHFANQCPQLTRFSWNGCSNLCLDGSPFVNCHQFTELFVDDCHFRVFSWMLDSIADTKSDGNYIFRHCRSLESLSIKNSFLYTSMSGDEVQPVSQEMLIKLVRNHPTLRWLRSDLSAENVATLKQERPDITFVTN